MGLVHDALQLRGFRLLVDGEQMGHLIDKDTRKTTIDSLVSGLNIFSITFLNIILFFYLSYMSFFSLIFSLISLSTLWFYKLNVPT